MDYGSRQRMTEISIAFQLTGIEEKVYFDVELITKASYGWESALGE